MKCYAMVNPNVPIEIKSLSPLDLWLNSRDKEITKHEVKASLGGASSFRCFVPVKCYGGDILT